MKRILQLSFLAFVLLAFGCQEIAPVLNPSNGGNPTGSGNVEDQERQVLIEEFTGVRCVNCPAGSEAIEALLSIHGEKLVAVSIHAGFFSTPYPESQQNLATPEGNAILNLLGQPIGYPTAVVNRTQFDGEESFQVGQSTWPGYVAQELATPPTVKIDLQTQFSDSDRLLKVNSFLYVQELIDDPDVRLTLYLIENGIEDKQLTPSGPQDDYIHKHVFREAITATDGELINESMTAGVVIERNHSFTVPVEWNINNCHVVGFVHLGGGSKDVLQAHEVSVE